MMGIRTFVRGMYMSVPRAVHEMFVHRRVSQFRARWEFVGIGGVLPDYWTPQ